MSSLRTFFAGLDQSFETSALNHGIHPYPAKFIPQIPLAIISEFTEPGDLVYDPMCGSGTTMLEAARNGRPAVGADINPISVLISRAKTTALSEHEVRGALAWLDGLLEAPITRDDSAVPNSSRIEFWFEESAVDALAHLKAWISAAASTPWHDLAKACFSAIIVGSSRQESETRWARKPNEISRERVVALFAARFRKSVERARAYREGSPAPVTVHEADARTFALSPNALAQLVVTSPPYANSHDYYLYNKLRLIWLDHDVRATQDAEIGSRNAHSDRKQGIETYLDSMTRCLDAMHRSVKTGGVVAVVVGDAIIRGEFFDMGNLYPSLHSGLKLREAFRFDQRKYSRSYHSVTEARPAKNTHVLIFTAVASGA